MSDKPRAVNLKHQDVVHYPHLATIDKLHLALMTIYVNRQAYAVAFIDMACLGEKLDVERNTLHLSRCLRMYVACHYTPAAWVYPSPLLRVATNLRIGLSRCLIHISFIIYCQNCDGRASCPRPPYSYREGSLPAEKPPALPRSPLFCPCARAAGVATRRGRECS